MRKITRIVLHTTAGWAHETVESIMTMWRTQLGWKNPGYHIIIDVDGIIWYVTKEKKYSTDISKWYPQIVTNGVQGFNSDSIHIAYIGGLIRIDKRSGKDIYIYGDTRTPQQVDSFHKAIGDTFRFLKKHQPVDDVIILGHRDLSPDTNNDGIIQENEWLKVCPTFNAIQEFGWLMGSKALKRISLGRRYY